MIEIFTRFSKIIPDVPSVLAWSQSGHYNRNRVYVLISRRQTKPIITCHAAMIMGNQLIPWIEDIGSQLSYLRNSRLEIAM